MIKKLVKRGVFPNQIEIFDRMILVTYHGLSKLINAEEHEATIRKRSLLILIHIFNIGSSVRYTHDCVLALKILYNHVPSSLIDNLFTVRRLNYSLCINHRPIKENSSSSNCDFYSRVTRLKKSWNLSPSRISITIKTVQ